jgi:hypothetical protein
MTARPDRTSPPHPREPVQHELPPLRLPDGPVGVELTVRRAPDGSWRGLLRFTTPDAPDRTTAEIFRADAESELWDSVRTLGDHYLRALYISLA